jgi:hypothetical protein
VGIDSTPVIDLSANALYVIAYVNGSSPSHQIHALNLTDLTDKPGSPVTVAASHKLTNGSTFTFNSTYQRQRPALLELNGNIYAGFGSYCDYHAESSRGWVLGWNATTLAPLPANQLNDTQATSPTSYFLSSVWMSGYGIAGLGTRLFFATGNSDCNFYVTPERCPSQSAYDGKTNIQESVVRIEDDLAHLWGTFTPANVANLDAWDADLSSGGVMLLPDQSGSFPYLAVAGGKDGKLFLLNRLALNGGGFNSAAALDTHYLDLCWCGPSYFTGSDGINRVVTSHGSTLNTWQLQLSPSPHLVLEGAAPITPSKQDPGFFTVVSSNGTKAGTAIIWAVGRPTGANPSNPTAVNLYAFAGTASGGTLNLLFSSPAGSWPNTGGNANIVPVVANGKVYVASAFLDGSGNTRGQLTIFGVPGTGAGQAALHNAVKPSPVASLGTPHVITGTLLAVRRSTLTLKTSTGKTISIDASQAAKNGQVAVLKLGTPYTVQGSSFNAFGTLQARSIFRAKDSSAMWPPDR